MLDHGWEFSLHVEFDLDQSDEYNSGTKFVRIGIRERYTLQYVPANHYLWITVFLLSSS